MTHDMDDYTKRLHDVTEWLRQEFAAIRTGQATPGLLDGIRVESYGTQLQINQVGTVGVEDARTLRITPWDTAQVSAVEKAIRDADLGVSVMTDSEGLRVAFPELTSERRAQLTKLAKSKLEEARISVRGIRDDVMKELESAFKAGELSEDDKFAKKEAVQKAVDAENRALEELFTSKEAELQN